MEVYSRNGTRQEERGNEVRGVAKYAKDALIINENQILIETDSGLQKTLVYGEGEISEVSLEIGSPSLQSFNVSGKNSFNQTLAFDDISFQATCCTIARKTHVVVNVCEHDLPQIPLQQWAPHFSEHPLVPQPSAIVFATPNSTLDVSIRVWDDDQEIDISESSACAAVISGTMNNWCEKEAVIHFAQGNLKVAWDEKGYLWVTGLLSELITDDFNEKQKVRRVLSRPKTPNKGLHPYQVNKAELSRKSA